MQKGVGIVVGLVDQAGTRVIGYGTTDRKSHRPVNGDSVFEIGSITKVFTAILLADMVERGEVRLDDPISKYLPDSVTAPTRNGKEITLAHLSTHMSGLPRDAGNFAPLWWRLCLWCPDPGGLYSRYSVEQMYTFLSTTSSSATSEPSRSIRTTPSPCSGRFSRGGPGRTTPRSYEPGSHSRLG